MTFQRKQTYKDTTALQKMTIVYHYNNNLLSLTKAIRLFKKRNRSYHHLNYMNQRIKITVLSTDDVPRSYAEMMGKEPLPGSS